MNTELAILWLLAGALWLGFGAWAFWRLCVVIGAKVADVVFGRGGRPR